MFSPSELALLTLGRRLQGDGYAFVTPTPATHARVLARGLEARDLRDVFGWNRPFVRAAVDAQCVKLLEDAGALRVEGDRLRSAVRFATIRDLLVLHSGYPTDEPDAVFFGPDTYRFHALVERILAHRPRARRLVEIGCGTGAAAILAARFADQVVAADVSPRAVRTTAINAELAGVAIDVRESDLFAAIDGEFDVVIANPPYLVDEDRRTYRHGGGADGLDLSLRIVDQALARMRGGTLILYTGAPIVAGKDPLRAALAERLPTGSYRYDEIDPDVFGEELERPQYARADRIAVVSLVTGP